MHRSRWLLLEVIVIAALTLAGYLALWNTQHALWTNGLEPLPVYPRPNADVTTGGIQSIRVILLGVALTVVFAWLVLRAQAFARAGLGWPAMAIPVVVAVALFFTTPTLSIDAYSYLSHGYLAATGSNPYVDPSSSVAGTPYGIQMLAQGWQAVHPQTPYGPVWTAFEWLAYVLSGGNLYVGILLVKLPVFLAVLGTTWLIWSFLARTNRDRALRGALLYLANPLILIELVGEGHNDGVMAFFVVLAVFAVARRWAFLAVAAVIFAALVKLNALPFVLPVAVALIAMRRSALRLIGEAIAGVVVAVGAGVLLIAPYWVGAGTFVGLGASGAPSYGADVAGWMSGLLGLGQQGFVTDATPATTVQLVLAGLLVLATAAASFMARTVRGLVRACGIVSLVILLLLPLEWPWYATLPAAVLPLEAGVVDIAAVVALTVGSRLVAPIGDAAALGVVGTDTFRGVQAFVGQTIPAVIGLVLTVNRSVRDRVKGASSRRVLSGPHTESSPRG
ncbi:hypothetical protein GCM10027568_34170 [Humibacter soli]